MLLLVPSNKIDEGTGKVTGSFNRVLVVLPSDTDLSSNVIVPDTAITTTLGTNTDLSFPCEFPALQDSSRLSRDPLGILRSSRPDMHKAQPSSDHPSHSTLGTTRSANLSGLMDQRPGHPYGATGDSFSRLRRHSHTGLVEPGLYGAHLTTGSRMRSRQSISCSLQYQHQQVRTPRALRAAFRKARKDQSPVLNSGSFSTDYATGPLDDDDDMMLSHTLFAEGQHFQNGSSDPRWIAGQGCTVAGSQQENGVRSHGSQTGSVDGRKFGVAPETDPLDKSFAMAPQAQRRVPSETVDVEGISDEEMSTPCKTAEPGMFLPLKSATRGGPFDRSAQDMDLDTSLDADMNVILGLASDMELVMPKFDDEYLDDLKNDPVLSGTNRRASSASSTLSASLSSPSGSHSSSTTITCISSHPSPDSRLRSPRAVSAGVGSRHVSSSPPLVAVKSHSQPPNGISGSPEPLHSPPQHELSTIHKDIDNLRRHRDSLQRTFKALPSDGPTTGTLSRSPPTGVHHPPSSPSSSNSGTTNEQKRRGQGPIYFKPSHHALPERTGSEHQSVMIIQSNQWTHGNTRVHRYPLEQGPVPGDNQIFTIQESITAPVVPVPTMPLDKHAIMTTNNISLATAHMEVLTPQEVLQEDYDARRNLRASQQQQHQQHQRRQRRRSSSTSGPSNPASAAVAAVAAVGVPMKRGSACVGVDYGFSSPPSPSRGATSLSGSCPLPVSSMHPPFRNGIHPLDDSTHNHSTSSSGNSNSKPTQLPSPRPPVHAIGPTPVPASYYIPPSAFRTAAVVAAEKEAERKRMQEEEDLKESFLVFPSPLLP
ncbi:hypothetical protein BGZ70_004639 [Mortierella alpina]|uniref:Uncharacterized protein n=1 Tax=Mortierella alpina TaxID=64518 RepID=A0A9P6M4T2_MORAP|nr:hypothetical protein BGZ70_004639 [Mortierella alpina]